MFNLLKALRDDENGVILSAELAIVGSILVVGAVTGMAALQKSINREMRDLAEAMESLDQTYSFSGIHKGCRSSGNGNCHAYTAGSAFRDRGFTTEVSQKGLIGIEDQANPQWQLTSGCNACNQCGGSCGGQCGAICVSQCGGQCGSQCGSQCASQCGGACVGQCGGQCGVAGGCGTCGSASYGDNFGCQTQSGCASTGCTSTGCGSSGGGSSGVPHMKVTEYPGTWNVPRTTNEWTSAIRFPELEDPSYTGEFGQRQRQGQFWGQTSGFGYPEDCAPAIYEIQEELQEPAINESAMEIPENSDDDSADTNENSGLKPVASDEPLPETPPGDSKE